MGSHPDVYSHPPYHLGRDLILNLHETLGDGPKGKSWEILSRHAVAKVREYRSEQEAARLAAYLTNLDVIRPAEIARFVWQDMPEEAAGRHAFVKENNIHHLLPFLVDTFPDARFVFQVRDPRDYFASANARGKTWLGNKFGSMRQAIAVWREDQLGGLAALGLLGTKRVHLMRYEDLVADGESSLRLLSAFLGLPFDPAMLEFHRSEGAVRLAVAGGPRENLAKPLMKDNFQKYRKSLSRRQIKTIESHLGDLMERFGYRLDFPRSLRRSAWQALRPNLTEPIERVVNGELRPHYKVGHRRLNDALDDSVTALCPPLSGDGGPSR